MLLFRSASLRGNRENSGPGACAHIPEQGNPDCDLSIYKKMSVVFAFYGLMHGWRVSLAQLECVSRDENASESVLLAAVEVICNSLNEISSGFKASFSSIDSYFCI